MEKLSVKMQKMILWITSYASIIALVLCGGYILRFGEDEGVKKTAVKAFIVNAVFIAVNMVLQLITLVVAGLLELGGHDFAILFATDNGKLTILCYIIKIVVYGVYMIKTLREKSEAQEEI